MVVAARVTGDLVTGNATQNDAADGRGGAAATVTELTADNAAEDRAADGACNFSHLGNRRARATPP